MYEEQETNRNPALYSSTAQIPTEAEKERLVLTEWSADYRLSARGPNSFYLRSVPSLSGNCPK